MKNTITVYIFYRFTFYLFLMLLFNKNKINHLPLQFQSLLQVLCWVDPLHIGWHWFSLGLFSSRSQTCEKVFKIKNDLVIVRIISISQYRISICKRPYTSKAAWRGNMQTVKGKRDFAKKKSWRATQAFQYTSKRRRQVGPPLAALRLGSKWEQERQPGHPKPLELRLPRIFPAL